MTLLWIHLNVRKRILVESIVQIPQSNGSNYGFNIDCAYFSWCIQKIFDAFLTLQIKVQVWDGRGGVRHLTISQRSFLEAATGGALVRRIVETDQALGTAWKRWKASSERDQEDSDNLCPSEDDKTLRLNQSKDQRVCTMQAVTKKSINFIKKLFKLW